MRLAPHGRRTAAPILAGLLLLGGCAQEPAALIPGGTRAILAHDLPEAGSGGQPITVEELLQGARHASRPGGASPTPASPEGAPISKAQLLAAAQAVRAGQPPGAAADPLLLDIDAPSGAATASVGPAARAAIDAAVGRLPPTPALRARIAIGPVPSADPVSGLARAEGYAERVEEALPERVRPAEIEYRPSLPPGKLQIEFAPAAAPADG